MRRNSFFTSSLLLSFTLFVAAGSPTSTFAAELSAQAAAHELRLLVPHVTVSMDEKLGVAQHIASPTGFLTGPAGMGKAVTKAAAAGPDQTVRSFLNAWPMLLGGDATILNDAEMVRDDITAHSGLHTKAWRQQLDGIPVYGGLLITHTTQREELIAIGSHFVTAPDRTPQGIAKRAAIIAQPNVTADAAVSAILRHFAATTTDAMTTQNLGGAIKKQILRSAGAKGDIDAHLTWFPLTKDNLRLAWEIIIVERAHGIMYAMVVDAQSAEILSSSRLTSKGFYNPQRKALAAQAVPAQAAPAAPARAVKPSITATPPSAKAVTSNLATTIALRVYTGDSPTPLSPGFNTSTSTQPAEVARTLVTLASLDATASPDGWIDSNKETRGNNVDAHLDLNDDDIADTPRPLGTGTSPVTFDFPINLTSAPSTYRNAAVTNLFYWCNFAHDQLYQLGFTETSGNFQKNNFSRGGFGNDEVQADAQDGGGTDNANFATAEDGNSVKPRMQMYLFTSPTPDRDGDLDATIVLHEYAHGLSGRLVGGGISTNLDALQSGGMGEGWSDFYALSLLSDPADNPLGTYAVGSYVTMNYFSAIRRYPYAVEAGPVVTNASLNPLTFSDIVANTEVHDMGEVWCQALWECRGELITKYGAAAGNTLMLQLVTDGLKLTPANPSYTQARDAILQADLASPHNGADSAELWRGFSKRGLGFGAVAGSSDTTANAVESTEFSLELQVSNAAGLITSGPPGGTFTPTSADFVLNNASASPINWTATKNQSWNAVSSPSGTLAAGASTTITVSLTVAANALAIGTWTDLLIITDTSNSRAFTRPLRVNVSENYTVATTAYSWIDPSSHSALGLGDDQKSTAQVLPFTFPFYGSNRNNVTVSSNGMIGFGATTNLDGSTVSPNNRTLPSTAAAPHDILAVWWDDLDPSAAGSVRIGVDGSAPNRRVIISWVGVPHFYSPDNLSNPYLFQAILEEATGDMICQYNDVRPSESVNGAGRSATIGVENAIGDVGRLYSFNGTTPLTNALALRFHYGTPPTVATPASATPSPTTTATTALSVLGADNGGEPALIYTWSTIGTPPAAVSFSPNGTNNAKNSTATFTKAGTYQLRVTIADTSNSTVTSDVSVVVQQTAVGISLVIDPPTASVVTGATQTFVGHTADQFGDPIVSTTRTVTWSTNLGTISTAGVFTAPSAVGTATVQAVDGVQTASATVTITAGGGGSTDSGGGGGGNGCGFGATSAALGLLFMLSWRRRRLGE